MPTRELNWWQGQNPEPVMVFHVTFGRSATSYLDELIKQPNLIYVFCLVVDGPDDFPQIADVAAWGSELRERQRTDEYTALHIPLVAALIPPLKLGQREAERWHAVQHYWQDLANLRQQQMTIFERRPIEEGGIPDFESFRQRFEVVGGPAVIRGIIPPSRGNLKEFWLRELQNTERLSAVPPNRQTPEYIAELLKALAKTQQANPKHLDY